MFESGLHPLLARIHAGLIARRPSFAARALARFAKAEQGSMLTLRWAAAHVESVERRAIYLDQALEEQRHARLFSRRSAELGGAFGAEPSVKTDAEDLFERLGEVRFLAFLHRGERRAVEEFAYYRDAFMRAGDATTAALFAEIVEEERHHQDYPLALIQALDPAPGAASRARRFVALWESWRSFRRLGRSLAESAYYAGMWCLYPLLAPLALWVRWVRPEPSGLVLVKKCGGRGKTGEFGMRG